MPIQGSLDEVSLADVLQLLSLGRKSGRLSLDDGLMQGHIYLNAGRICYASVVNRRDQLGDILVKAGKITRRQLEDATERQTQDRKKKLGEILVGSGSVARADLDRFVRAQVQEAVAFMFTWNRGSFKYESRVRPQDGDFLVSLDAGALLLEAARRVDEWSILKRKIPSFDMVFRIDEARIGADVSLTEQQKRILPLLDGSRDVAAVVETTGLVEFEVAKALYGLITAGFAHLVERRAVMRHLSHREFLAYLVREAEFADSRLRRKAARHLAECSLCSTRLKRIHRQTGEVRLVEKEGPAVQVVKDRRRARGSSATPRIASEGRLSGERRSGSDRRHGERRWGDRRLAARPGLSAAWPSEQRGGEDRRTGDRRMFARRSADRERPRRVATRRPSPDATATPKVGPKAAPPAAKGFGRPAGHRSGRRSSNIEWLVTPDAALELLRQRLPKTPPAPAREPVEASPAKRPERSAAASEPTDKPKASGPSTPTAGSTTAKRANRAKRAPVPGPKPARGESGQRPKVLVEDVAEPKKKPPDKIVGDTVVSVKPVTVPPGAMVPPARASGVPTRPPLLLVAAALVAAAGLGWFTGFFVGRGTEAGSEAAPMAAVVVGSPEAPFGPATAVVSDSGARAPAARPVVNDVPGPLPSEKSPVGVATSESDPPAARVEPETSAPAEIEMSAPRSARSAVGSPAPRSRESGAVARTSAAAPPPMVVAPSRPDPAPTVATIRGVVRDARTGLPLAGARVVIPGGGAATRTNAVGVYEFREVAAGPTTVEAEVDGYRPGSVEAVVIAGAAVELDVALRWSAVALEPDTALAGQWLASDRAEAAIILGQPIAVIPGLWIESIAKPVESSRPKVRVAHISASGERIVLIQSRSGAFVRGGPARVTALRIMPPSEAYPITTGTASFGRLLVTAQTAMSADSLRILLRQLGEFSDDAQGAGTP